jgi:hypothetical protein
MYVFERAGGGWRFVLQKSEVLWHRITTLHSFQSAALVAGSKPYLIRITEAKAVPKKQKPRTQINGKFNYIGSDYDTNKKNTTAEISSSVRC